MRVISGIHKGRKLFCVDDLSVRPATDKVKGSIFNSLQHRLSLTNIKVLDLFAGSGSLGIEALSRGASHTTFVDDNKLTCEFILKNINFLKEENRSTIITTNVASFLKNNSLVFGLIFADPPYSYGKVDELPALLCNSRLDKNGYLIIEHLTGIEFPKSDLYNIQVQKRFGKTTISYFTRN